MAAKRIPELLGDASFLEALAQKESKEGARQVEAGIRRALVSANAEIWEAYGDQGGTTVVAAVMTADAAFIASVGDSRAYLVRKGKLQRLTADSNFLGLLSSAPAADIRSLVLRPGDTLGFFTDGLFGRMGETFLRDLMAMAGASAQDKADLLMKAAREGGDNRFGIVVQTRIPTQAEIEAETETPEAPAGSTSAAGVLSPTAPWSPDPSADQVPGPQSLKRLAELTQGRVALISPKAVAAYPELREVIGKTKLEGMIRVAPKAWIVILPEGDDPAKLRQKYLELLTPLLSETYVSFVEFGDKADFALFEETVALTGFSFPENANPLQGAGFRAVLRLILANLAGVEQEEISEEELVGWERDLSLQM
jgi:hypothetical protein